PEPGSNSSSLFLKYFTIPKNILIGIYRVSISKNKTQNMLFSLNSISVNISMNFSKKNFFFKKSLSR
ncbi:hypothetical protein, partial [Haloflavibacter putidus]|uniref:hypothetical protein n=1 Tax=Haloflavibacter putidus TaxID=2576776 RepID=UPI001F2D3D22